MPDTAIAAWRHQVRVQQFTVTKDGTGGDVLAWSDYCVRPMAVMGTDAREFEAMRQRYAEATYALACRYDATSKGITPKMRVITDGKTLEVLGAIDPTGRHRELHIAAKEVDPG